MLPLTSKHLCEGEVTLPHSTSPHPRWRTMEPKWSFNVNQNTLLPCLKPLMVSHCTENNIPSPSGDPKAAHDLTPVYFSNLIFYSPPLLASVQLPFSSLATSTYFLPLGLHACYSPGTAPSLALLDWPFSLSSGLSTNASVVVRLPMATVVKAKGRHCWEMGWWGWK